jgi:hypothetical protein
VTISLTADRRARLSYPGFGRNGFLICELPYDTFKITIEDPAIFEKPRTFTFGYRRMPDYQLIEYICEDNRERADEKGLQKIRIDPPANRE